jgi:antitoxin VapB
MTKGARAKIFWSGGSQAVRLPRALRLPGTEVLIRRSQGRLVLEPVPEGDDWGGFWERLVPLKDPLRRHRTRSVEKRKPV